MQTTGCRPGPKHTSVAYTQLREGGTWPMGVADDSISIPCELGGPALSADANLEVSLELNGLVSNSCDRLAFPPLLSRLTALVSICRNSEREGKYARIQLPRYQTGRTSTRGLGLGGKRHRGVTRVHGNGTHPWWSQLA